MSTLTRILFLSVLFVPVVQATASSPDTPIHGPEANARLDMSRCFQITLQPGEMVTLHFYSSAHYENQAIVYDQLGNRMLDRGNKKFGMDSWTQRNQSSEPRMLFVSSWHKRGRYPSSGRPWSQSPIRVFGAGSVGSFGFEDSTDNSFNDVVVRYQISR